LFDRVKSVEYAQHPSRADQPVCNEALPPKKRFRGTPRIPGVADNRSFSGRARGRVMGRLGPGLCKGFEVNTWDNWLNFFFACSYILVGVAVFAVVVKLALRAAMFAWLLGPFVVLPAVAAVLIYYLGPVGLVIAVLCAFTLHHSGLLRRWYGG
jgi:hypothetical protein